MEVEDQYAELMEPANSFWRFVYSSRRYKSRRKREQVMAEGNNGFLFMLEEARKRHQASDGRRNGDGKVLCCPHNRKVVLVSGTFGVAVKSIDDVDRFYSS